MTNSRANTTESGVKPPHSKSVINTDCLHVKILNGKMPEVQVTGV